MKKNILIAILYFVGIFNASALDEIGLFSSSSFDGWKYTRSGFIMSQSQIASNKIIIYKDKVEGEYNLISPVIDVTAYLSVVAEFDWMSPDYTEPEFNIQRNSPILTLLDENDREISSSIFNITTPQYLTKVSVNLTTNNASKVKLKISAPNSDVYNSGIIRKVKIYGDVTGSVDRLVENKPSISINDNILTIKNIENSTISITNALSGIIVFKEQVSTTEKTINLNSGVYIVMINNTPHKILIQ